MVKTITKLIAIFMAIALCACLFIGCEGDGDGQPNRLQKSGFVLIERKGQFDYLYHNETKVMYVIFYNYNQAGMTVLLNPDGTPMIWEGN